MSRKVNDNHNAIASADPLLIDTPTPQENTQLSSWQAKRKTTYRIYCVLAVFLGAEYSMIIPSLFFYLNDVIKTDHVTAFYDLSLAIYYVASIFGSLSLSVYVDRTRNTKQIMIALVILEIIGSCLYIIYTSVYFPIVARIIQGLGDVNMSLITAEVARVFPREECTKRLANLVACFSGAFVLSPGLNIIFKYIDFEFYGFRVSYGNFPGILMAILFSGILAFVIVKTSNLSKEYDLKEKDDTKEHVQRKFSQYTLFKNIDFVLLIFIGFLMSYSIVAFLDVSFPIISAIYYKQTTQYVGGMFLATGLLFMIVLQVIKKTSERLNDFYFLIAGLCVFVCSTCLLLIVSILKDKHPTLGLVLLSIFVLTLGVCWCVEQVFVKTILAKMIPSEVQAFGEAVRRAASALACISSSLVTGFIVDYLYVQCIVTIVVVLAALVLLVLRKHTLIEAKPIELKMNKRNYQVLNESDL
eukprot:TCONS_00025904-protein